MPERLTETDGTSGIPSSRKLRVLLVIKCLGSGGAERLLVDTVATGDHTHFSYEVAYILEAQDGLVPEVRAGGTPVHSLGCRHNGDLRWMTRLRALIARGGYDVVHFHLPYTAALGRLAVATLPRTTRPAIVYTEHSVWDKMANLIKVVNRAGIGLDDALIVVSPAAHDALPAALRDRARVIVHGVDLSRTGELTHDRDEVRAGVRAELGVPEGELLALTVANLRPEKGYDLLLDVVERIDRAGLPVHFVAAGRGPLEDEVASQITARSLSGRLQLLGHRDDVLRLVVAADLFVLPSHQEGLPVVLMEATSAGLPIVATAVGGVPQVLTDGVDGLVVPPGDAEAMTDAIRRVVTDQGLRSQLAAGALQRSAMFDVSAASRQIEEIYVDVTRGRARA